MQCLRWLPWAALLGSVAATPAAAQGRAHDAEPDAAQIGARSPEANDFAPEGPESEELRRLRLIEEELFGDGQPLVDATEGARLRIGEPSPAVTSDVPDGRTEHAEGSATDLAWLRGLNLPDIPVRWDDRVIEYLEFYRNDPRGRTIMAAWLERADRWGEMVRAEIRQLGLPEDLLYVAMIESGFDPSARSRAGAVGMWQFVRRTGEEYGLEVDHWVDERMDPEKATVAGARYLGDLYRRFGSWELALAAYNMGYGALLRAIRKYNTNDYWVLSRLEAGLPFETTFYVAKVMACAIVGRNPERFGFADRETAEPVRFETVTVTGGTPLSRVARAARTDADTVAEMNPSLRRGRVPPGSDREVRIPAGTRDTFARNWTRMRPRNPAQRPYVVRFGESLDEIARRFRTTTTALRTVNELEDDERIGAGFRLMVPAVEPRETEASDEEPPVVAVPAEGFSYPNRRRVFYRVSSDDDVEDIARFFDVDIDEVRRWNNVDPHAALQPGMILQLFVPTAVDLSRAVVLSEDDVRVLVVGSEEFFDYHEAQQGRVRFRYTVRPGDTLTAIARRFELSVGSLARINRFARDTLLHAGDEIIVYAPRERVPARLLAQQDAEADRDSPEVAEADPDAAEEADREDAESRQASPEADPDAARDARDDQTGADADPDAEDDAQAEQAGADGEPPAAQSPDAADTAPAS